MNKRTITKQELEQLKLKREVRKLQLECIKLQEEIVAVKLKRRAIVFTLIFTACGIVLKVLGY